MFAEAYERRELTGEPDGGDAAPPMRIVQAHLFPEANPATIIWSAHAGYFWRAWTVAYAGAMGGFAAFAAARRSPVRAARALRGAVVVASLIILYQGLFVP